MTVVISGNPVDGFTFYGPFETQEDAIDWATDSLRREKDWWISRIHKVIQ